MDPLAPLVDGPVGPLYFLYGKEPYLLDRAVEILKQRVLEPATAAFNLDQYDGKESGGAAGKILAAVKTVPMMAKRRLVLVRRADELSADDLALLIPYVEKPYPEACLVLVGEKVDMRMKFFTAWKKQGKLVKLDPISDRDLAAWVTSEARRRGASLASGAASALGDELGSNLGALADAIERLSLFVASRPDKQITVEDVEELTTSRRQRTVFQLAKAIGEGRRAEALGLLGALVEQREAGVKLVFMLARHVRQLLMTKELLAARFDGDLAQRLGVPPFAVNDLRQQARRLDADALRRMHTALYDADRALKSSRLDEARILEGMVLEMTRAEQSSAR